jgi:hypothetical protein
MAGRRAPSGLDQLAARRCIGRRPDRDPLRVLHLLELSQVFLAGVMRAGEAALAEHCADLTVLEPLRELGILDALGPIDRRGKDLPAGIFIGRLAVDARIGQLRRLGVLVVQTREIAPDRRCKAGRRRNW